MRKSALSLVFVFSALGLFAVAALAQKGGVMTGAAKGTWKLDVQKSDFGEMPKPKAGRLVVTEDKPMSLKYQLYMLDGQGKRMQEDFAGAVDGKPYPIGGNPKIATITYTASGDAVNGIVTSNNGGTVNETITLSPDKNTMTVKGSGTGAVGPDQYTEVWQRVSKKANNGIPKPIAKKTAHK